MHYLNEQNILVFLMQVFVLLLLARALGELLRRWNQPTITAEILVGVVLGPTLLGRAFPGLFEALFPPDVTQQNMLDTVAWIGILLFLLRTGLEMDFSSAWRQRGGATVIAGLDIVVPILIAFGAACLLPDRYLGDPNQRLLFCLFIATIMTISALPVTARVLNDLKMYRTDLGFLIMCALSLNDIVGWVIFTLVLGLVTQPVVQVWRVSGILVFTILFTFLALRYGRTVMGSALSRIQRSSIPEPGASLTLVVLLGVLFGAITVKIGIHALFGFFIAGMVAGESPALSERTRNVIIQMVDALFVPLFFATIGLKIDFLANFDVLLVSVLFVIGVGGRFLGAWLGAVFARQAKADRSLISIAHTPGGEMQIVVGILALEYGLITESVFVAIVVGAVLSSVIRGPWMNWALRRRREAPMEEFFARRAILPSLRADSRDDAIRELCEVVVAVENADAGPLTATVLQRENLMGTAIGQGCAVPHGRVTALKRTVVAVGRSAAGIDWNSPDGQLVRFVFLVLTPPHERDVQLQILRFISIHMSDARSRDQLAEASDAQAMWRILHGLLSRHRVITPRTARKG